MNAVTKEFVLAGKAIFTIQPPAGVAEKAHYTFKVTHKEASERWPEAYFVSLLTGPENTSDYTYVGMLEAGSGLLRLTAKSALGGDSYPVRLLERVLARVWAGEQAVIQAAGYALHHEGKCGRCGRLLTVPASIESGIGPECALIMAAA